MRPSSSLRSSAASHPSSHTASGRCYCNAMLFVSMKMLQSCFNTASSENYYFITFVFPSFQSGTRDVRTSSSLRSSAASHPSSHTTSGKHCCNLKDIEQARRNYSPTVSIPRAVSAVATVLRTFSTLSVNGGFNTASGRYCCNFNGKTHQFAEDIQPFQYRKR